MKHSRETRWMASELKFLVTPECALELKKWARRNLEPDPFASPEMGDAYLTSSIYFDTPALDVFHERGSYGNAKYRVRRYGQAEQIFLERKLKNHRIVAKRRSIVGIGELRNLENAPVDPLWDGFWFQRRLTARRVSPVCQISYRRTALLAPSETGLVRLTIDEDLRAIAASVPVFDDSRRGQDLLPDLLIVEMKFCGTLPELFCRTIEEFSLEAQTVSKYKLAARQLGLVATQAIEVAA